MQSQILANGTGHPGEVVFIHKEHLPGQDVVRNQKRSITDGTFEIYLTVLTIQNLRTAREERICPQDQPETRCPVRIAKVWTHFPGQDLARHLWRYGTHLQINWWTNMHKSSKLKYLRNVNEIKLIEVHFLWYYFNIWYFRTALAETGIFFVGSSEEESHWTGSSPKMSGYLTFSTWVTTPE